MLFCEIFCFQIVFVWVVRAILLKFKCLLFSFCLVFLGFVPPGDSWCFSQWVYVGP